MATLDRQRIDSYTAQRKELAHKIGLGRKPRTVEAAPAKSSRPAGAKKVVEPT
jgi:hypothetical protein